MNVVSVKFKNEVFLVNDELKPLLGSEKVQKVIISCNTQKHKIIAQRLEGDQYVKALLRIEASEKKSLFINSYKLHLLKIETDRIYIFGVTDKLYVLAYDQLFNEGQELKDLTKINLY